MRIEAPRMPLVRGVHGSIPNHMNDRRTRMPQKMSAAQWMLNPLALAAGLLVAQAAVAEDGGSPWYIGASQAFNHDNNVFRRANGGTLPVVSDTTSSTGLLGGIDQPFGRQRFYANGTAAMNRHKNQEQLDNTSYGLNLGLDWSSIERLSGSVTFGARQSLANYGDVNATATTAKNLQKSREAAATVRYGVATAFGIEGGVNHNAIDYTIADDLRTVRQNGANLGLRWGGGRAVSLLVGARTSQAKYPTVATSPTTFESDTVDRRDLDATVTYAPTGLSVFTFTGRATHETHSLIGRQNFNGFTGAVTWDYHLTGKINLRASLNRDTGTATTFLQFTPTIPGTTIPIGSTETLRVDSARLSTTAMLDAGYEITSKIGVNANLRRLSSSSGSSGSDSLTVYGIGVHYQPTRTVRLGCTSSRETRSGVYSDNTYGCNAQLTFQ
jgi:hypothetical protein